ncbi:MAG: ATPase [Gammaproteobacteria bacterium]|nr:permease [Gammaproteobacteria bacterium]NNM00826.1 ATPase [Gammaproteobacteria bacterium]
MPPAADHCHPPAGPVRPDRRLVITALIALAVFGVSLLPGFGDLNAALLNYLSLIWWAVLLGFVIGGLIDHFVPDEFIYALLGAPTLRSVLLAVVAGFLMSACSHGILAIAMQLYRKGAGIPAVMAFLLATPWANLPITILMFGFFGVQALLIIACAMAIALTTALGYTLLQRAGRIEAAAPAAPAEDYQWSAFSQFDAASAARGVYRGAMNLANMVLWWIIIGLLIAAVLGAYLPQHVFTEWLGPTPLGLAATLAVATVIEVCSEGSAPIAFELYEQIGKLGNPFVFLMAGVVTDYTEIGLVWTTIGRRTAIWLPLLAVPQVLLAGMLLNLL